MERISPLTGWLIDRIGTKTICLIGIGLLVVSYLTYGVAQSWEIIVIAMGAYWIGFTTSIHSCATLFVGIRYRTKTEPPA